MFFHSFSGNVDEVDESGDLLLEKIFCKPKMKNQLKLTIKSPFFIPSPCKLKNTENKKRAKNSITLPTKLVKIFLSFFSYQNFVFFLCIYL